jgi:hypothetical protein
MTYTPGVNCHVTLSHPDIDAGVPYGFLVVVDDQTKGEGIQFTRNVISPTLTEVWISFDVICADRMINPDGSFHTDTRAQMYAKLSQFLAKTSGLILTTFLTSYIDLGSIGFTADERHKPTHSIIKCSFNNTGFYWPVDAEATLLSVWDGTLTWNTSYWR